MESPIVSTKWLSEHLNDNDLIILDASPKSNVSGLSSEFNEIRIPGAKHFDLKNDFSDSSSEFPNTIPSKEQFGINVRKLGINNSSTIVVYDNLGIYSSPRVWWLFKTFGHENIFVLDGGLPEWVKSNYITEEKVDIDYPFGNFTSNYKAGNIRFYEDIKHNTNSNLELVIDARSSTRFNGTSSEPRIELQSGCILNSANLPFQDVLDNGKFISKEALKTLFSNLNPEEKSVIFSCGSGLTACIIALAYEIAFKKPFSIYDGSWTEWATKENLLT